MKKIIFAAFALLISSPVLADVIRCEGWFQNKGGTLEKSAMPIVSSTDNNTVFSVSSHGYDYRVNWDKNLTCFYITIEVAGERILLTTARIPTPNHPENFTDLNLPNGPRLSVNCESK